MTIAAPTVLTEGVSTTDAASFLTTAPGFTTSRFVVAIFYNSSSNAANAVQPVITSPDLTWTVRTSHLVGSTRTTVATSVTGGTAPTSGGVTATFDRTMGSCGWHILQFPAGSVDLTTPFVQVANYDYVTTPSQNPALSLTTAPATTNGVLAVICSASSTIVYTAGTGFGLLGTKQGIDTPSIGGQPLWGSPGGQTITVSTTQLAPNKAFVALEFLAAAGTNAPPVAHITASTPNAATGDTVTLSGSTSTDADGTISTYNFTPPAGVTLSGTGATRTFVAPSVGAPTSYTFSLTVTDNSGATSPAATVSVTVSALGSIVRERTGFQVGDAFTATAALTYVSNRMVITAVDAAPAWQTWGSLGLTAWAARWVGEFSALPASEIKIIEPLPVTGARSLGVSINATGKLLLRDAANVQRKIFTTSILAATKYRIEVTSDGSTTATVVLYFAGSTVAIESQTFTSIAGTYLDMNTFRVGAGTTTPAMPVHYIDDVAVKNTGSLLGPWSGSNQSPTAVLTSNGTTAKAAETIILDAGNSADPDGTISTYTFNVPAGVTLTGTGVTRSFKAPYATSNKVYPYTVTVTDNSGMSVTSNSVSVSVPRWPYWRKVSGVLSPITKVIVAVPNEPLVDLTYSASDSRITVNWVVTPNGRTVDGVFVGRTGPSINSSAAYESQLLAGLTGSLTFTNLVNSTDYEFHVTPVIAGVRHDPSLVYATPVALVTGDPLLLGIYHGNPNEDPDAYYFSQYANYPMLTSSYYTGQTMNVAYETARVQRGESVFLDFDTKGTPGLIGNIADWDATGQAWVNAYLTDAQSIASASIAAGLGAKVFVSLVHEWEVKRAQNVLTDTRDRTITTYAAALDEFLLRARQIAPACKTLYWTGGFRTADISAVMAAMTIAPDGIAFDPYVTEPPTVFKTLDATWATFATYIDTDLKYQQWGSPPLYIGESAIDKRQGNTNVTAWYTNMRATMVSRGIQGAIIFARDKVDADGQEVQYDFLSTDVTKSPTPGAKLAFGNSVITVRGNSSPPAPPVNVRLVSAPTTTTVPLAWDPDAVAPSSDAITEYRVYRSGTLVATTTVPTETATITGLTANTAYSFTIRSFNGQESTNSVAFATTTAPVTGGVTPAAPTTLRSGGVSTVSAVRLAWNASTVGTGGAAVTEYRVYRGGVLATTVTGLTAQVTGLSASTAYNFTVKGFNGIESAASNLFVGTTAGTTADPWTLKYDVNLASPVAGTTYGNSQRTSVCQSTDRQSQVTWGPNGMLITAERATTGAEPKAGGPTIWAADVLMKGLVVPQHAAVEFDVTLGGYLGLGMFPAAWSRPLGAGEGEKDYWEYCGGNIGANNEMKTTMISTPYGTGQTQTVMRWALNQPGYQTPAAQPNRMSVFGGLHTWRIEMAPNIWTLYRDGVKMTENSTNRSTVNRTQYGADNGGSFTKWDQQMESTTTWYPRFTYQVGNGTGNTLGGTIPNSWLKSTYLLSRLEIYDYTP